MDLDVVLLPDWSRPEQLAGRAVVVIDILRATTTITQALAAGAVEIIPCLEVAAARNQAAAHSGDSALAGGVVLGGERGGQRIDGFQLGNSPAEYTPATVGGKVVLFTTTNGTRAMQFCRSARRVLLGSWNSFSALLRELQSESHITLLCAGTDGRMTAEDVLFAGAVAESLSTSAPAPHAISDETTLAMLAWNSTAQQDPANRLVQQMMDSRGGRNLVHLGMAEDIARAARRDTTDVVAELHLDAWRIRRCHTSRPR